MVAMDDSKCANYEVHTELQKYEKRHNWENFYLARSYRSTLRVKMEDYSGALEDFNYMNLDKEDKSDALEFRYRGIAKFETHDTIGACNDWKIAANHMDSISIEKIKLYCK